METKPRFKNSFGVTGTQTELTLFGEEVKKIGWVYKKCTTHDFSEHLYFKGGDIEIKYGLNRGQYWSPNSIEGSGINIDISTIEGWQRALSLAEEKEEVQALKDLTNITKGKVYKFVDISDRLFTWIRIIGDNEYVDGYDKKVLKPSTKEAHDRQELLEQAKKKSDKEGVKCVSIYSNTEESRYTLQEFSEALKETLNKMKK